MDHRAGIIIGMLLSLALPAAEHAQLSAALHSDLETAQQALAANDPKTAIKALAKHADSNHPLLLTWLGSAHEAAANDEAARVHYRQALSVDPTQTGALAALLNLYARRELWTELLAAAGTWLNRDQCSLEALLLVAQAADQIHDGPLALRYADQAQLRFPASPLPRRLLAKLAIDRGDHVSARHQLQWLISHDPNAASWWHMLAWIADTAEERRRLLELAVVAGGDAHIHLAWVASLSEAGHHHEAFKQIQQLDLSHQPARDLAIDVAIGAGHQDHAVALVQNIPRDERTIRHHRLLAQHALYAQDSATARQALHELVDLGVTDEATFLRIAQLEEAQGNPAAAEAWYRQSVASGSVSARLALARLLLVQQRHREAKDLLVQITTDHPELTTARQLLATLSLQLESQVNP